MIRGIDLRGAVAVNVITMIGIGPLITIPLVLAKLHGSTALWAWVVGAAIALCDGLVYAELGSLYPRSGSTYVFLREAFGRDRWGRLFAFLFAWEFVLSAPLVIATGYIGFAHYAGYLWPPLGDDARLQGIVAAALGIVTLLLLYRPIRVVGAIGVALAGIAVATLGALVVAAVTHGHAAQALDGDPHVPLFGALLAGLGPSLVITLYDYAGYAQACTIGDEVRAPERTVPRSIVISIVAVALLYVATQLGVLAVIPWRELVPATPNGDAPALANYVASSVVERVWGTWPARIMTLAVLVTAFASTYGGLLGASRVPYAAALDGVFFRQFARLHERGRFPTVSLVVLGLIALPACFLSLGDVINALTAGIVIVQSLAQIVALFLLRARGVHAPYRMWLFPIPAVVAFAGWVAIFFGSGTPAIAYGLVSIALGVVAYLWRARRSRDWPFARTLAGTVLAVVVASGLIAVPSAARAATWGHATFATRAGETEPEFRVDGRPFFLYGAAFFYERLPRDAWRPSMLQLRALGINTLDLYVPWNWHELADGDFDFNGRTSPRRDLDEVLRLARELDFAIVLRPGPVIRNEWRNGGYPAWLLSRPEYGMPLHDLLEGRYPPTATLQNAHSDDAAAEWMRNATHLTYAKRWLERVLHECEPDADRILAVALDDDQGAYIDNQTYPAPHFQAYIAWLRDVVHGVTGTDELTFINTYQMKVTSSSPVWAMGNWYQSDAYALGEHDRGQLEFSTALLHTRPGQPMMASEFQAGWLEQPDDVRPRPADPTNTSLALGTMFAQGVRGIVNFPAQDTLYPAGWEAPFANAFYAWDAALALQTSDASPRAEPTAAFGALVRAYGPLLAASHVRYDAAIAYLGASVRADLATDAFYADLETQTIVAQRACRDARLACALVDPNALDARTLARYPLLVVPLPDGIDVRSETNLIRARLQAYVAHGGRIVTNPSSATLARAFAATGHVRTVEGASDATFAPIPVEIGAARPPDSPRAGTRRPNTRALMICTNGATFAPLAAGNPPHDCHAEPVEARARHNGPARGFLTVVNYGDVDRTVRGVTVARADGARDTVPAFTVPRHTAVVEPVGLPPVPSDAGFVASKAPRPPASSIVPVRDDAWLVDASFDAVEAGSARAYAADVYRDGTQTFVLDNGRVRVALAPDAGARAFVFEDDATGRNVFTTVGALRDDVAVEPPLSTTDRIAKYTHQFPAGTFNRPYAAEILENGRLARVRVTYDAPDVLPNGAHFERTLALAPNARAFEVTESAYFPAASTNEPQHAADPQRAVSDSQRAVSVTSLSVGAGTDMSTRRVLAPNDAPFTAESTVHVTQGHALAFYDTATHELATIAWRAGDVEDATILERRYSLVIRLTLARDHPARLRFAYDLAPDAPTAATTLAAADLTAQHP